MRRGQSHVVGVALMLSVTVLALGVVTAGVGALFEAQAAGADAKRVADGLDVALDPVETTGAKTAHVAFGDGRLTTAERRLRVLRDGSVVAAVDADALVFTAGDRRVASLAGAIVRGEDPNAWVAREPPIVASRGGGVLVVGAPKLNASHATVAGSGTATLRMNVSHSRSDLGSGSFAVAIESETPNALASYFQAEGTTTSRRDFDGNGIESVVAEYPGTRTGYLVVHDVRLEVGNG